MTSAYTSEVKRTTDAYVSEVQMTEVHADPVHRQDLCCSVLRGQVRMIQFRKKTVEFPMVQDIVQILCVAVAMRESSHRPSKLKGSSKKQLCDMSDHQDPDIGRRWKV